jgi:branched-chain amino acid transport system substrate-binding protein
LLDALQLNAIPARIRSVVIKLVGFCLPEALHEKTHLEIKYMKTTQKILGLAIASAIAAVASNAVAQTVVKIGHVGPLTGSIAHLGKDNENGAKLAIEDLNAKKIKLGGKEVTFVLVPEDDAGDPKQGTTVAQKLVDAKVNGVIGHLNSGTTIPASKIYADAGIPTISPSATAVAVTTRGLKTMFRIVANDGALGGTLGRFAVKELKGKSIAVIDDRTAYGQGVADEFEKAVKGAGGNIVGREFTNDKATDFNAILTKLKGKTPDIVFFGGMDAVAGPMMRQMKQLDIKAKFMGGDGICSAELAKLAGEGMADDQVVCAEAGGVTADKAAAMDSFKGRFKTKFNADVQIYAPYVYDATMMMVAAMQKADSAEPAKYLPELAKLTYDGVTGKIAFDAKGDILDGALTLYTYKAGKQAKMMVVK